MAYLEASDRSRPRSGEKQEMMLAVGIIQIEVLSWQLYFFV